MQDGRILSGRTCLVIAGSHETCQAISFVLARSGANVAIGYQQSQTLVEETCELVRREGVKSKAYRADVSSEEEAQVMCDQVLSDFGPVSVLVNNPRATHDSVFLNMRKHAWDEVITGNLNSTFNVTHALLPSMSLNGWGRIINVVSVVGQIGGLGQANYAVTQRGLIAFTMTLARELARKGITVNSVVTGYIEDETTYGFLPARLHQITAAIPLGRLGNPEEVASAVGFLASSGASYITGQVLDVNGGIHMFR